MEAPTMLRGPTRGSTPAFAGALDIDPAASMLHAARLLNRENKIEEGSQEQTTSLWD